MKGRFIGLDVGGTKIASATLQDGKLEARELIKTDVSDSDKLVELEERKRAEEVAREKGEAQDVNFGSQIRNYVLHPYKIVNDLRTGHEVGNVDAVLDGDLDEFVRAYLLQDAGRA